MSVAKSVITWLARILAGATFVYSGFVKAIDPWGTLYKMEDYLGAMGLGISDDLVLLGVFLLISFEFVTGVCTLLGAFRRCMPYCILLFMAVMLPLTLWTAIADPVPDCGCFGDALHISNWATFWKNVVLTALGIWLLIYNGRIHWLVTPALQWVLATAAAIFVLGVSEWGYQIQPAIDYRPYPVGSRLVEVAEDADDGTSGMLFVYSRDGVEQAFGIDDIPDEEDGWEFVRREEGVSHAKPSDGRHFAIFDTEQDQDVSADVVKEFGAQYILLFPQLAGVNPQERAYLINSIYDKTVDSDAEMIAVVSGSDKEIEHYVDLAMPEYPIYTAEDTQIKELARGNPSLVYLEDGVIKSKISFKGIQLFDDHVDWLQTPQVSSQVLISLSVSFIIVLIILVFSSFLPKIPWKAKKVNENLVEKAK